MKIFGLEIRKAGDLPVSGTNSGGWRTAENGLWAWNSAMTTAELLSNTTVSSCVMLLADSVASLSGHVYYKQGKSRVRDDKAPLAYLIQKAPNDFDVPFTFWQTLMLNLTLNGNAFLFVERNWDNSPKSLTLLEPENTHIHFDNDGKLYYSYIKKGYTYKILPRNMLHIPAYRLGAVRGLSPLEYANHAAKLGLTLDQYTNTSFDGGIHSKLLVEVPVSEKKFTEDDAKALKERLLSSYGGKEHANDPFIIGNGTKATALNLGTNADAQLTENRIYSEREIAKIYRVPLFMLGKDDSKFSNQEQANTFYLQHTLGPWLVRIQQYFNKLLTYPYENHYVEFDTDTILRADYKSRMEMYQKGLTTGIYTPNQIYAMENLPVTTEKWGDQHFMPVNLSTIDKISVQKPEEAGKNAPTDNVNEQEEK